MPPDAALPRRPRGRPLGFDPDAVLKAVQAVFWNRGYAATSLDDIAAASGLNRPSLYRTFGDKQALYLAALEKSRTDASTGLQTLLSRDEPLRPALGRMFATVARGYVQGDLGQRGCFLIGTAVTEAVMDPGIRQSLAAALADLDQIFVDRLERARAAGELTADADVVDLARLATATLNGMAVRARAGSDAETLMSFGRAYVALVCGPDNVGASSAVAD